MPGEEYDAFVVGGGGLVPAYSGRRTLAGRLAVDMVTFLDGAPHAGGCSSSWEARSRLAPARP